MIFFHEQCPYLQICAHHYAYLHKVCMHISWQCEFYETNGIRAKELNPSRKKVNQTFLLDNSEFLICTFKTSCQGYKNRHKI